MRSAMVTTVRPVKAAANARSHMSGWGLTIARLSPRATDHPQRAFGAIQARNTPAGGCASRKAFMEMALGGAQARLAENVSGLD
jgi:hypothetical protein